jgi:hypothetical protein
VKIAANKRQHRTPAELGEENLNRSRAPVFVADARLVEDVERDIAWSLFCVAITAEVPAMGPMQLPFESFMERISKILFPP